MEKFGKITFAFSIMALLSLITEYGFNISATRDIALVKSDKKKLSEIFSGVISAKCLLGLISVSIMTLLFFIPKFNEENLLFIFSFFIVLGQAFLPVWFFQGMENILPLAIINIFFRFIYLVFIFLFVTSPGDYLYVNLFWGCSLIFSSICSFIYIIHKYKLKWNIYFTKEIITSLKSNFSFFITNVSVNTLSQSNPVILGFLGSYNNVGYFGVAEKVFQLCKQLLIVFSQVIFPGSCSAAEKGVAEFRSFLKLPYLLFSIFFFFFSILCIIIAPQISLFFTSVSDPSVTHLVSIVVVASIFTCLNIPAYQTLLAFNFKKSYSVVMILGCILSIFSNLILSSIWSYTGTVINILLTEILIAVSLHLILLLKHREYYPIQVKLN